METALMMAVIAATATWIFARGQASALRAAALPARRQARPARRVHCGDGSC